MTIRVSIPSQYPLLVAGLENCLKNSSEIKIVGTSNLNIHFEFNSQKVDILIIGQDSLQTIQSKISFEFEEYTDVRSKGSR